MTTQRNMTAAMLAAIAAAEVRLAMFFEGTFNSIGSPVGTEYVRLWTGYGDVSWNGETWVGSGELMNISPIEESQQLKAIGFRVLLSGMPTSLVSTALNSAAISQGQAGKIWLATFDAAGAMIADPYLAQQGKLDTSVVENDGETCTIALNYESRLIELELPRPRRYTQEDQKIDYPDDEGFKFVTALQNKDLSWG